MSNSNINQEEISLKQVILKAKEYAILIFKNWKIILLSMAIFGTIASLYALSRPISYTAKLTFMVNENEGSSGVGGGAASILGALGMSGQSEFNLDKIIALSKSDKIIHNTLLSKGVVNNKLDYFGNHLAEAINVKNKEWKNSKLMANWAGFHSDSIALFSLQDLNALKFLTSKIIGGIAGAQGLMTSSYDKESGIMVLRVTSPSEDLTINFLEKIFESLSNFYIEKSVQKEKSTFDIITRKVDSIRAVLGGKEMAQAAFQDSHYGLLSERPKVPQKRLGRDVNVLNVMYAEAVKNAEMADFALKNRTPFVQPIDRPLRPINPEMAKWKNYLLIGVFIGAVLSTLFIVIKKIIHDAINA
jgi:hypothetical protein